MSTKAGEVHPLPTKINHRDRAVRQRDKRLFVQRGRAIRGAVKTTCDGHRFRSYLLGCCGCVGCEESFGPVGDSDADDISQSLKFRVREFRVREFRVREVHGRGIRHRYASSA